MVNVPLKNITVERSNSPSGANLPTKPKAPNQKTNQFSSTLYAIDLETARQQSK